MSRPITLNLAPDDVQVWKHLNWLIRTDNQNPGISNWEREHGIDWDGIKTASALMGAAITSFLNNEWVVPNESLPSHKRTYGNGIHLWPSGHVPYYPERAA